jgi:hypothetical protein
MTDRFVTAYPVNVWLVRRGIKEPMWCASRVRDTARGSAAQITPPGRRGLTLR